MAGSRIPEIDDLPEYPSWLMVVKNYVKCQRLLSLRLAELGLTAAQYEVLLAVARDEGCSQKSLARWLLVAKSNVTGLLKRMGAEQLIERQPDPDDARGRRVYLTNLGRSKLQKAVRIQAEVVQLMTKGLSRADSDALLQIMSTVADNLDEALVEDRL
jgi:DNA-binding MarR family transcriptional regulator